MNTGDDTAEPAQRRPVHSRIVVMGPAGCGKSTLAHALAQELGWEFIEGDDFHSPENRAKMSRDEALTDDDRLPFLDGVGGALAEARNGAVASCSALRRSYRDRLRELAGPLFFVLPEVPRAELTRRLEQRPDSFMPPSLIDSQLSVLEALGEDEEGMQVDGTRPVQSEIRRVREQA